MAPATGDHVLHGYADGTFRWQADATRAGTAAMLARLAAHLDI